MLLTKVLWVLLLPAVALLHSDEYGPRSVAAAFVEAAAPYVDIAGPLAYYLSHGDDYNARHFLASVPPWMAFTGYWTDSGSGVVKLWTSGRGEYAAKYVILPLDWYVYDKRVLVLEYRTLGTTELYSSGPPPKGMIPGSLSLSRGHMRLHGLWPDPHGN